MEAQKGNEPPESSQGIGNLMLLAPELLYKGFPIQKEETRGSTLFIFIGFGVWAIFLALVSERADKKKN